VTGCCARHGQEELFGEKTAANDACKYRRKGPDPMARSLARRAGTRGVEGASVLEIGGGVGQVALGLLKAGAASAMGSPGIEELRWLAPVRPGDTLSARLVVLETAPSGRHPGRGTIRTRGEMVNQDGVTVMSMVSRGHFARRQPGL